MGDRNVWGFASVLFWGGFFDGQIVPQVYCTNTTEGPSPRRQQPRRHTSSSILISIDRGLYYGSLVRGLGAPTFGSLSLSWSHSPRHRCSRVLGLASSLGLGLWPAETKTFGSAGMNIFPKLGMSDINNSIELVAAIL